MISHSRSSSLAIFWTVQLCSYQSHRLAQHEDDILIHYHSGVGEEEVGGGQVEEGEGADHGPSRYEAHLCQERDYFLSLQIGMCRREEAA